VNEIKSALELALDKTKKIKATPEEREQLKKQEDISRATGLLSRYMSDEDRIEDLEKALEDNEVLTRTFLSLLWAQLNAVFDINEKVLKAIGRFQGNGEAVATKIARLYQDYQEIKREKLKGIEKTLMEKLAQRGIMGSAIVPNPMGSKEAMQLLHSLEEEYRGKLQEMMKDTESFPRQDCLRNRE
jgi:hypothetical protein